MTLTGALITVGFAVWLAGIFVPTHGGLLIVLGAVLAMLGVFAAPPTLEDEDDDL